MTERSNVIIVVAIVAVGAVLGLGLAVAGFVAGLSRNLQLATR